MAGSRYLSVAIQWKMGVLAVREHGAPRTWEASGSHGETDVQNMVPAALGSGVVRA